jgi:gas vesicle protein
MAKKKEFDINAEMYLDKLFNKYFDAWQKDIETKIIEDLMFVKKYKGELARSFEEVKGQRNTLIGCMQEILSRQEELMAIQRTLISAITKQYPSTIGKIEGIEVND